MRGRKQAKKILSIDVGLTGAIVSFSHPHSPDKIWDMPVMESEYGKGNVINPYFLADIFAEAKEDGASHVYIEQVSAMPNQGVSSMFKFGSSFGVLQGVSAGFDLPMTFITPQRWKKYHNLIGTKKDDARLLAIELFPDHKDNLKRKKDGGRADALLIGQYAYSLI